MRRALVAIAALSVALAIPSGCGIFKKREVSGPTAEEYLVQAEQMTGDQRDDEALALLSRAIEENPELTVAHIQMGDIYRRQQNYVAAERSFSIAALQQPQNFDAQFGHGVVLQLLNRLAESIRAYLRALTVRPNDFEANLNISMAYRELDGPRQALAYAQRAVELNPSSAEARSNLAAIYSSLERYEDAVREYESAAELMTLTPELLLNWADALGKLERYEEMANTLDTVVRIAPSASGFERAGFAAFKLGDYQRAIASFRQSLELDNRYYPAHNGLGVCLLNEWLLSGRAREGVRAEAISHLRQSLRVNPNQSRIVELVSRYGR